MMEPHKVALCDEYEKNICKIVTYDDLLQKANWGDYEMFCGGLACVFDLDPLIVGHIANLDKLWRPDIPQETQETYVNYIQWLSLPPYYKDPIEEILSYLFSKIDTVHMFKIIENHGNIDAYFEYVSTRLWKKSDYIRVNYEYYYTKAKIYCEYLKTGKI